MSVRTETTYCCIICLKEYKFISEAMSCCPHSALKKERHYCTECDMPHTMYDQANKCCEARKNEITN